MAKSRQPRRKAGRRVWKKFRFGARNVVTWVLWIAVSGAIFWRFYYKYKFCPQYFYLHKMLGESLGWSRGSAAVLWVSCSLMLLPMCRNFLAFTRNKIPKRLCILRRLMDRNIWFHRACAVTTVVAAAVHTAAHLINGKRFSEHFSHQHPALNFAQYKNQDPLEFVMFSVAGSTGIGMMFVLLVMVAASTPTVRSCSYEVFWFTHHVFIIFYVMLAVHGLGGVVKHQTNLDTHPPGCQETHRHRSLANSNVTSSHECAPAEFEPDEPQAWKLMLAPLVIYMVDRLIRTLRGYQDVQIVKVVQHPCDVVELRMKKTGFYAEPGQYVYVNCPSVARFEWHPFTLTQCPAEGHDEFSIHFKATGDWTEKLGKELALFQTASDKKPLLAEQEKHGCIVDIPSRVRFSIDGPYGSPCMDVWQYRVNLCIATGIGVTPFAAVFNKLRSDLLNAKPHPQGTPHRIYFVWVCQDVSALQWLADIIHSTHQQLWEQNRPDFLICQFYVTRRKANADEKACVQHDPLSSWFNARLSYGRPDWQNIFRRVSQENSRSRVGVFYCGQRSPSTKLRQCCQRSYKDGTHFVFNKEVLS